MTYKIDPLTHLQEVFIALTSPTSVMIFAILSSIMMVGIFRRDEKKHPFIVRQAVALLKASLQLLGVYFLVAAFAIIPRLSLHLGELVLVDVVSVLPYLVAVISPFTAIVVNYILTKKVRLSDMGSTSCAIICLTTLICINALFAAFPDFQSGKSSLSVDNFIATLIACTLTFPWLMKLIFNATVKDAYLKESA